MHRSGTSAFTRVLSLLGCDLPSTPMPANKSNETGHWESEAIRQLNDRILASAGTRWDDWLQVNPGWLLSPKADEFREEALRLVREEFGSSRLFVLKDPRICRLVPFWLAVLEEAGVRTLVVSPVRNPLEVAASLASRDGFEAGLGHLLWLRHVLDAEFASRGTRRFFTGYDRLIEGWARTATDAQTALGIAWPRMSDRAAGEIESFLSERHRHHQKPVESVLDNPTLSDWLRGTFEILSKWSTAGEDPQDFSALDNIRTALNTAAPAFSRLLSAEQDKAKRLEKTLANERQRNEASEQQISSLKDDVESRVAAGKAADQVLADTRSKLATAEKAIAAEQEKAARLEKELAGERQRLAEATQQSTDTRSKLAKAEAAIAEGQENAVRLQTELDEARQRSGDAEQQIARLKRELESQAGAARAAEQALAETRSKLAETEKAAAADRTALETERRRRGDSEQQVARLESELEARAQAADEAETSLMQVRHRLAQTESGLAQRRHESEQTAGELAVAREDLRRAAAGRSEAEKIAVGLKEHVVLLMSDVKERQAAHADLQQAHTAELAEAGEAIAGLTGQVKQVLAVLDTSRHELASRLAAQVQETDRLKRLAEQHSAEFESRLQQQAREIETLRGLVEEKQHEAHNGRFEADRIRQDSTEAIGKVVAGVLNGHGSPLHWRPFRFRRQAALLKRTGVFDAEWYLRHYTDVAEAGMDPLRHYIEFGAREGRAPGPALAYSNGHAHAAPRNGRAAASNGKAHNLEYTPADSEQDDTAEPPVALHVNGTAS